VSAPPSSSGGGLLTLCPCSSTRSLSRERVLHQLLQRESFPQAAALHKLPQRGSFPWGAAFRNRLLQHGSPTRSQALPANLWCGLLSPQVCRSWQESAPARAPHGVTASFRHPPALVQGPFHGLQVDICSTVDLHGLQGNKLPHHGLSSRTAREDSLLRCLKHLLPPPSSLTLVSAELFLSHFLTPLSQLPSHLSFYIPFLKYVIPEVLPPSLIGLALGSSRSVLEAAGTGFIRHGGSFSQKPPL